MFSFKKPKNVEFTQTSRRTFLSILTKLQQILSKGGLTTQFQVIQTLINLLNQQKDEEFAKCLEIPRLHLALLMQIHNSGEGDFHKFSFLIILA